MGKHLVLIVTDALWYTPQIPFVFQRDGSGAGWSLGGAA